MNEVKSNQPTNGSHPAQAGQQPPTGQQPPSQPAVAQPAPDTPISQLLEKTPQAQQQISAGTTDKKPEKAKPVNTNRISITNKEKLALISNFSTMIAAGIPILDTVDSLIEDAKGNQKKLLDVMRGDLNEGKHIYESFEKFPRIFDKVSVSIIKASEEAGTLDVTLADLKENIKKDMEFSDKVRSALMYPVFIMFVFAGVMLMILIVVVPKISEVFSRLNVELPLPTKIMIFVSNLLINNTVPVVVGFIVLCVGFIYLLKRHKQIFLDLMFKMPLISNLAEEIDITRFSHSFHLLLNAGIPITSALDLLQHVVMKKEIQRGIVHAKEVVTSGKKLSEALKDNKKVFPSIMIKITEAGEKTGSLEKAMEDIAEYMDYQVTNTLKTLTALLEPIMLVVVGVMIGGMMLAIIAPIYNMIGQVGPR